jgi:hypothetical protein
VPTGRTKGDAVELKVVELKVTRAFIKVPGQIIRPACFELQGTPPVAGLNGTQPREGQAAPCAPGPAERVS